MGAAGQGEGEVVADLVVGAADVGAGELIGDDDLVASLTGLMVLTPSPTSDTDGAIALADHLHFGRLVVVGIEVSPRVTGMVPATRITTESTLETPHR